MTGDSVVTPASGAALVALLSWPLVALPVFALRKRRARVAATTAWMLLLPLMFLPSGTAWDPPLLPPLTKFRVALVAVALALRLFHGGELLRKAPLHQLPRFIFALFLAGAARTIALNQDTLVFGTTVLPALTWYDYLSAALGEFLDLYLPFSIGQRVFFSERALIDLFRVLTTCALIYAPLMLFEVRMSPQLHMWIYGFYPSEFQQAMRGDGFRPIVFMNHGLSVAGWMFSCVCATLALGGAGVRLRYVSATARVYLNWALLLLTKSMGPLIYAALATFFRFRESRSGARFVLLVTLVVAVYPVLRAENLFPTERVLATFASVSAERTLSLKFRFDNEDLLLRHAMQRPVFGWGTFGRNQVYSEQGKVETVADGEWIIVLGCVGYVGHVTFFALLLLPLWRYLRRRKFMPERARALCSALAVLLALFLLDLLPNSRSDYLSVMYAGALWSLSGRLRRRRTLASETDAASRDAQASADARLAHDPKRHAKAARAATL